MADGDDRSGEAETGGGEPCLGEQERRAARRFVGRVLREVPARLVQASLFGSKARRQARPDSDVDILLVFHRLAWDREPHASQAEGIAEEVARESGVPVTTWSVSLVDLEPGNRTPMLVDALEDSVPLWWERAPLPALPFTPYDALRCVDALFARLEEGSEEFARALREGDRRAAHRRSRDDVVRLCTAGLLLRGVTRPRRAEAVGAFLARGGHGGALPRDARRVLEWAAASFGPEGRDEEAEVAPPPGGARAAARTIDLLRRRAARDADRLRRELGRSGTPWGVGGY